MTEKTLQGRSLVDLVLDLAADKKAHQVVAYHVAALSSYTDWVVLCSGNSDRQVDAISRHIIETLKQEHGVLPLGVEGQSNGQWVLADLGEVIVHVFYRPVRTFYDLDGLWADAERIERPNPDDDEADLDDEDGEPPVRVAFGRGE